MTSLVAWLETHEKLAGWAQFLGAVIALAVTYFTAFAPIWRRKRQLRKASERLLAHGFEVLESFHRTTGYFLPEAVNLKAATLTIRGVINEIDKFPIYELDDHGSLSTARRLVAISTMLEGTCLFLDETTARLGDGPMSEGDRDFLRQWIEQRLQAVAALVTGAPLKRPDPSDFMSGEFKA